MTHGLLGWSDAHLHHDLSRVIARLLLPGEELAGHRPRAGAVTARILALPEKQVETMAVDLLRQFGPRHDDFRAVLAEHAAAVTGYLPEAQNLSDARSIVLGASFTAEYTLEGAALCNPSVVPHPDQSDLGDGQLRVAVSLRAIGEGHISAIEFATAVLGPGDAFTFLPRQRPAVPGEIGGARWQNEHLRQVLRHSKLTSTTSEWMLGQLPATFTGHDIDQLLPQVPRGISRRAGSAEDLEAFRRLVHSNYQVNFPDPVSLCQRVLLPALPEESNGIEDARFVSYTDVDGSMQYRATYTAFDGRAIAPRLLTSPDLETFTSYRLTGPAARNKGLALFPRPINGRQWALCRGDGESTWLTGSDDGLHWDEPDPVQQPESAWEVVQIGNCGSPIETERGWLVLTHGVGPMRVYVLGAILLDLDDPSQVIGHLSTPLLVPPQQDGYVPNVVYSCGALVHDGRLWVPTGIGDCRIGVASGDLEEILDALEASGSAIQRPARTVA